MLSGCSTPRSGPADVEDADMVTNVETAEDAGVDADQPAPGDDVTEDAGSCMSPPEGHCVCTEGRCGYLPDCDVDCGACPVGMVCGPNTNTCMVGPGGAPGLGHSCEPAPASCLELLEHVAELDGPALTQARADTLSCIDEACLDDSCGAVRFGEPPVCRRSCAIELDEIDNETGAPVPDGIEDPCSVSGACWFAEGASPFTCVERAGPEERAAGTSDAWCMPADANRRFARCSRDADCDGGNVCVAMRIRGAFELRCAPGHAPGLAPGASCDIDPAEGWTTGPCANSHCLGPAVGCARYCATDADCVDGWPCQQRQIIAGSQDTLGLCWPPPCTLDTDCADGEVCLANDDGRFDPPVLASLAGPHAIREPTDARYCVSPPAESTVTGESCDPLPDDLDDTLPPCESYCTDGVCGGLCASDADCSDPDLRCAHEASRVDVSNPRDGTPDVVVGIGRCAPYPQATGACEVDSDCPPEEVCKLVVQPAGLADAVTATAPDLLVARGVCIAADPAQQSYGSACGVTAQTTGVAKLCRSGLCWRPLPKYDALGSSFPVPGRCSAPCGTRLDCAPMATTDEQAPGPAACLARSLSEGVDGAVEHRVYVSRCVGGLGNSSLEDCAASLSCAAPGEACRVFPIARSPDEPATVEHLCVQGSDIQGAIGAACALEPGGLVWPCAQGPCLPDADHVQGYCSGPCKTDDDCGGAVNGMFCDTSYVPIPRPAGVPAAVVPMCRKAKPCIHCESDHDCAGPYICSNTAPKGALAAMRCVPICGEDSDCPGSGCAPARDSLSSPKQDLVCNLSCI